MFDDPLVGGTRCQYKLQWLVATFPLLGLVDRKPDGGLYSYVTLLVLWVFVLVHSSNKYTKHQLWASCYPSPSLCSQHSPNGRKSVL